MKKILLSALLLCLMPFFGFSQHLDGVAPVSNPLPGHVQMNLERTRDDAPKVFTHVMYIPTNDQHFGHYYAVYDNGDIKDVRIYDGYYFTSAEYYRPYVENPDPGSVDECFPVWTYTDDRTQGWHRLALKNGSDCGSFSPVMNIIRDLTYDYVHNAPGREGRMLGLEYGYISQVNMNWGSPEAGSADTLYRYTDHDGLYPLAMACDLSGTLYFVNLSEDGESSRLYYFSPDDPDLTDPLEVGELDWPARFIQTMAFDHQNGDRLYWWQCDGEGKTNLVEVIVEKDEDGMPVGCHTELIADMGHSQMGGMVFEFLYRPYTAFCADNELGTIRLKSGTSYTLTQNDYKPGKPVDFQVTSNDPLYTLNRVKVLKHGTDKELLTINAEDLSGDFGSFLMCGCDVDIVGEWIGGEHGITYQWTPDDVPGLDITGPAVANYTTYVTVNYSTDVIGYLLTDLTAQSGSTDLTVTPLSPDQTGKRQFLMPADDVVVTGNWLNIELEQLEDVCQYHDPGIPSYEPSVSITSAEYLMKKPGTDAWVTFADSDFTDGNNFDVVGTYQYRIDITNEYGTFQSSIKTFQVYEAPQSIAIEGDAAVCEGGDLSLSVVPTPDDAAMDGMFQWYKDGTLLPNETQSQLNIGTVSADDAGNYSAVYTIMGEPTDANPNGTILCQIEAEAVTIEVLSLPEIIWVQPDTSVVYTGDIELQATPEGGIFSYLDPSSGEWVEITGNTFGVDDAGVYQLIYNYVDENGCANVSDVINLKFGKLVHLLPGSGGSLWTNNSDNVFMPNDMVYVFYEANDCQHNTGIQANKTGDNTVNVPIDYADNEPYFIMPDYDVDLVATWDYNMSMINYQWTPVNIGSNIITGPSMGTCGSEVTVSYKTNINGYILTDLTVQSGDDNIDLVTISAGKRKFTMPDGSVTVTGTYQLIEIDSLPDVCQYQAPGVPECNITGDNIYYTIKVKKPGTTYWSTFTPNQMASGSQFNVAGTWQYRLDITNGYGTFQSLPRYFQVYEAPQSIAIEGTTSYCAGSTLELNAVPTPAETAMDGSFRWFKDETLLPNFTQSQLTIANSSANDAGSYTVVYVPTMIYNETYPNGEPLCEFEAEAVTVTITDAPTVAWVTPANDTNDTIQLSVMTESLQLEATPAGGTFTYATANAPETPITIEGGLLNPSEMGSGTYQLTYSYTDPETGCGTEASINVKISKRYWTDIDIRDNDWFNNCINNGFRYEITNAREMGAFAALLSYNVLDPKDQEGIEFYTFDNDTVWISSDIDLLEQPYYFRPLNEFKGTLNGLGHVIGNMVIDEKNLIMVFNKYSRIENIGFLNAKITNESETKAAIDIKGTMYNSYFSNPELSNITFNYYPEGNVQNVYYYNERDEEVVSKYIGYADKIELCNLDSVTSVLPAHSNWDYSLTQQIYQASQLNNQSAKIRTIMFHGTFDIGQVVRGTKGHVTDPTRTWEIYLTTTDKTSYESEWDYIVPSRNTKVFDGSVTPVQNDWYAIQLDVPFEYDGDGNILLTIHDKTGDYCNSKYSTATATDNAQALYFYQDEDDFDLENPMYGSRSAGLAYIINDIRFGYYTTLDATSEELLSGEGQDEATGYLPEWVWLKNSPDFYSWMQDPSDDDSGNYGYPVMDTANAFKRHHYVSVLYDDGYELGGDIKSRVIDDTEYVYAMNGDVITFQITSVDPCHTIDTIEVVAMNLENDYYMPIEYALEDGVFTFTMPDDNLDEVPYKVVIDVMYSVNEYAITYQWTPSDVTNLEISGFNKGACGYEEGVYYTTSFSGYIMTNLTAQSGDTNLDVTIESTYHECHYTMPAGEVTVTATYQAIELDSLPDLCQYHAFDAVPGYAPTTGVTEVKYEFKKPNSNWYVEFSEEDILNPDSYDVAGTWQYRVWLTNDYASYRSEPREFQVYEVPEITWISPTDGADVDGCYTIELHATPEGGTYSYIDPDTGESVEITGNSIDFTPGGGGGKGSFQITYNYEKESPCINESTISVNLVFDCGDMKKPIGGNIFAYLTGNHNPSDINVSLYPNPTQDEVKILCDEVAINRVTVLDMLGQVILDNEVNGNETVLHLKDAATGMYLVKVTTAQGFVMKKLMVE